MAEVKGKFITLAGIMMCFLNDALDKADAELVKKIGLRYNQLDPEGWYNTKLFNTFMETYASSSTMGEKAIVALGKNVYPTIKSTMGLPHGIRSALDLIKYEAQGFLANHRGNDVKPRIILKAEEGDVVVQAPAPGYNCRLYEGVFLGILGMYSITNGRVVEVKCIKNGDTTCEFHITW